MWNRFILKRYSLRPSFVSEGRSRLLIRQWKRLPRFFASNSIVFQVQHTTSPSRNPHRNSIIRLENNRANASLRAQSRHNYVGSHYYVKMLKMTYVKFPLCKPLAAIPSFRGCSLDPIGRFSMAGKNKSPRVVYQRCCKRHNTISTVNSVAWSRLFYACRVADSGAYCAKFRARGALYSNQCRSTIEIFAAFLALRCRESTRRQTFPSDIHLEPAKLNHNECIEDHSGSVIPRNLTLLRC